MLDVFAARPGPYWDLMLTRADIPCGAPLTWDVLRHHSQVVENEFLAHVPTDAWGTVTTGGIPWKFSRTPAHLSQPPIPGIDTDLLKAELASRTAGK